MKVKGASHWPTPPCPDLLFFSDWYAEFSWGQCCRQQLVVVGWGRRFFFFFFSPNNPAQVSAGAQCPVSSAPSSSSSSSHPVSLSARRRRFWFWIEGPSCHSGARASHWRSWAFSWAGSAQRRRVERAPCTWPLGRDKCCKELRRGKDKGQSRQDNVEEKTESPDTGLLDQMMV